MRNGGAEAEVMAKVKNERSARVVNMTKPFSVVQTRVKAHNSN